MLLLSVVVEGVVQAAVVRTALHGMADMGAAPEAGRPVGKSHQAFLPLFRSL
jgi:hypothetical protein